MFKKIINWWRYKKALNKEYSKISFNCENCSYFYFCNKNCGLLKKDIKNPSYFICNNFEVSRYKLHDAQRIALEKTSNFREVEDD